MATYTPAQLAQYFEHIGFAPRDDDNDDEQQRPSLAQLTRLQKHHQARIPFDSIGLHYSPTRQLSLDAQDLFDKLVARSRGGYCLEVNALFAAVLRSLGYAVVSLGARVHHERLTHMVNRVTIAGTKYLVDVGFGSRGPLQPVPLVLDGGHEFRRGRDTRCRLEHKRLARSSDAGQRAWVYATQAPRDDDWLELYSFTEMEFFAEDFEMMNAWVMARPQSLFVQTVLAWRVLMDARSGELVGGLVLNGDCVKRVGAGGEPVQVLERLQDEEQRVRALERYFYIVLTEREKRAIRGLASELGGGGGGGRAPGFDSTDI